MTQESPLCGNNDRLDRGRIPCRRLSAQMQSRFTSGQPLQQYMSSKVGLRHVTCVICWSACQVFDSLVCLILAKIVRDVEAYQN